MTRLKCVNEAAFILIKGSCADLVCPSGGTYYVDLDEEIDYLQSVIAKQQVTEGQPPRSPGKNQSQRRNVPQLGRNTSCSEFHIKHDDCFSSLDEAGSYFVPACPLIDDHQILIMSPPLVLPSCERRQGRCQDRCPPTQTEEPAWHHRSPPPERHDPPAEGHWSCGSRWSYSRAGAQKGQRHNQ